MQIAITREVSARIGECELTCQTRQSIDVCHARQQHHQYEMCLQALGCTVQHLPEEPDLPDSVFVEDTAILLDELAVITRPGAASRRLETGSVERALQPYRRLVSIESPGFLDGGDVLILDKRLFVGRSSRSNESAIHQLRNLVGDYGYTVTAIPVSQCLHLKSAATQVAENALLINRDWVDSDVFGAWKLIDVDPAEPGAANALYLRDAVVFPVGFPATRMRLEAQGIRICGVDASELAKAEGGVTCCSLIFTA